MDRTAPAPFAGAKQRQRLLRFAGKPYSRLTTKLFVAFDDQIVQSLVQFFEHLTDDCVQRIGDAVLVAVLLDPLSPKASQRPLRLTAQAMLSHASPHHCAAVAKRSIIASCGG